MLPYDSKPWAKPLARAVIGTSTCALIALTLYLYSIGQLRIPECVGIFLLFLTVVPPNLAVLYRKPQNESDTERNTGHATAH